MSREIGAPMKHEEDPRFLTVVEKLDGIKRAFGL